MAGVNDLTTFAISMFTLILVITVVAITMPIMKDATTDIISFNQENETITPDVGVPVQLSYDTITNITSVSNGSSYILNYSEYSTTNLLTGTFNLTQEGIMLDGTQLNVTYDYAAYENTVAANLTEKGSGAIGLFADWFKILIIVGLMVAVLGMLFAVPYLRNSGGGGF